MVEVKEEHHMLQGGKNPTKKRIPVITIEEGRGNDSLRN